MKYPGLLNKAKANDAVSDVITVNSITDLPYNSKSGSIAEIVNKGVKELSQDAIFPHLFYIHINNTNIGDIAQTDDGKTLSIQENLEAVYYTSNNQKKTINYQKVAIEGQIYREYEIDETLHWKNLNNIKIFAFKSSKDAYLYNGEEWEKMDYVQKSDFAFDKVPIQDSSNLLTSGVVYNELINKADLINGKVPSSQLPSYVDDVIEFPSLLDFPEIGESGKIYIDVSTNSCYRWSGSIYIEIQSPIELDEYPIQNSENAVQSGGVYSALQEKQDIIPDLSEIRQGAAAGATALQSFTETDPTVPSWAKAPTKPTYTASEVGALPNDTVIPDDLSDLNDDSTHRLVTDAEKSTWNSKQDELISGTNIKTVQGTSLLGSGNITLDGGDIIYTGEEIYNMAVGDNLNECLDVLDELINEKTSKVEYSNKAVMDADSTQPNGTIGYDRHEQLWYIFDRPNGEWRRIDIGESNEIASIATTESTVSGGNNTVTITESNGTTHTFNVKNGTDGRDGVDGQDGVDGVSLGEIALVQTTGDSEESVMSQKAVTEYGRKVTAEDLNGTSDWIKARLTEEGWEFGKELLSTGEVGNSFSFCVTGFIPMEDFFCNNISIVNKTTSSKWVCWYDENKTFVKGWGVNGSNSSALTDANYKNAKYVRITLNPLKLQETYIYDNSTQNYYYRFSDYIVNVLSSKNLTADTINIVLPVKRVVDESLSSIGRRCFGTTSVFDAKNKSEMCWSKKRYNISSKPWVDVVCYNVSPGNAQRSCWFGFSPSISSNKPSTLPDYIGFVDNVWSMDFIVRRNGVTVHTTTKALDSFSGGAVIFGCRFDFRRKTVQTAWRSTGGAYNTSTIDLSAYDLDLGPCYMCTTIGYCSYPADLYVGWNNKTNMSDFSAFFSSPLTVGQFKKFAEYTYPSDDIDGSVVKQFTNLMKNWSATQDENGHWVASIDVSSFTAMMHDQPSISSLHYLYNNWDLQIWVGKIKATNGSLQFKQRYTTIKDVYDLTDNVFLTAVDDVYTITSGHTVEVRMVGNINGRGQMLSFLGTCTVEMWDWEVHVAINTNITPENYDGKKIFGGIEFLFNFPNLIVDFPLVSSNTYYAQGFMKYASNKVYVRVYDTSTNTYIDKQISNT